MASLSKRGVLTILVFSVSVASVHSQQEKLIVLDHADSLLGKVIDGEDVRELVGNVRFRQGTVIVNCDRALQYLQSRKVSLTGNVVVRDDTLTLRGRRGMYYNNERTAEAFETVRLDDGQTTLTADYGRYYVDDKKAFFRGNVKVRDSASTLTAGELTYYRKDKRSVADGNVQIHSMEDNLTIYGNHFENYSEQKFSRMTQQPKAVQIDTSTEGEIDTFVVRSRLMESYRDSVKRLVAVDSVQMSSSQLAGESGFALYLTDSDSIIMRKNPFVWYEDNQVSGDSIFIKLKSRRPERVYVRGDAFAISRSDSLFPARFNQLTGELITLFFQEGKIQRIEVDRTATSVYYLYEDQEDSLGLQRRPNGINKTTGDHVVIYFAQGRADKISVFGGVEGEYFPENMIEGKEAEYNLAGFNWREDHPGAFKKPRRVSVKERASRNSVQRRSTTHE